MVLARPAVQLSATDLRVIVCEPHPIRSQFVEVRRRVQHQALVVGTQILPTGIVAHDDKDVGSALLRDCACR